MQDSSFQQLCECPVYRARSQSQLFYSRMFEFPCYSLPWALEQQNLASVSRHPWDPHSFSRSCLRWGWSQSPKLRREAQVTAYLLAPLSQSHSTTSLYLVWTLRIQLKPGYQQLMGRPIVSSLFWRDVKRNIHLMGHFFTACDNLWASSYFLQQLQSSP